MDGSTIFRPWKLHEATAPSGIRSRNPPRDPKHRTTDGMVPERAGRSREGLSIICPSCLFFLSILLLIPSAQNAEPSASHSTHTDGTYVRTSLEGLTSGQVRIDLPFDLIFPSGYVVIQSPVSNTLYLIHESDLDAINQKGGEIAPGWTKHPIYTVGPAYYMYFDPRKNRFNLEDQNDRDQEMKFQRLDRPGVPVLLSTFQNRGRHEEWLVVQPNTRMGPILITFLLPQNQYDLPWKPARRHWIRFLRHVRGEPMEAAPATLPYRELSPQFPDDALFSQDIYYDTQAEAMEFPEKLPVPGQTTEEELYKTHSESSLIRRMTFHKTGEFPLKKGSIKFDRWLVFAIKGKEQGKANRGMQGYETLESFGYDVFIKDGIVTSLVIHHRVRQGEDLVPGPLTRLPEGYPDGPGESPDAYIIQEYLKIRSPLFRRVRGRSFFYFQDYLTLPPEDIHHLERMAPELETHIPHDILLFPQLKNLILNEIESITCKITELKELESLSFSAKRFSEFPECFSELKLQALYVRDFPEQTLPSVFANISLNRFTMTGSALRTLPAKKPNWDRIESLDLSQNKLEIVPSVFLQMPRLRFLSLSHNSLEALSFHEAELPGLERLELSHNPLKEFPEGLTGISSTQFLIMDHTRLKSIPESINGMHKLFWLHINHGKLSSLPEDLSGLKSLVSVELSSHRFRRFPPGLLTIPELTSLQLGKNEIESIPLEVFEHPNLGSLDLSYNRLTELPSGFCEALKGKNLRINLTGNPLDRAALESSACARLQIEIDDS